MNTLKYKSNMYTSVKTYTDSSSATFMSIINLFTLTTLISDVCDKKTNHTLILTTD